MKRGYKNRIDQPIKNRVEDKLDISQYQEGLINYLNECETPMTISIQGEWGSGKTSLMNLIDNALDDKRNKIIRINTWNYSLFEDADVAFAVFNDLMSAIQAEINDDTVSKSFQQHKEKIWKIGKAVGKAVAAKYVANAAAGSIDELDIFSSKNLEDIKNDISKSIQEYLKKKKDFKLIFLVDDLDRLKPELAIVVLEILKNLFDLKGCIFVLAIDYEVVVKGLKGKFGSYEENEREYRQFFEKIIQLPFSMPVENYSLDNYLYEQLSSIDYFSSKNYLSRDPLNKPLEYLSTICRLTVGKNPRAIKRVVNYISLTEKIVEAKKRENKGKENKLKELQFFLISVQVAYPQVYSQLMKSANFPEWSEQEFEYTNELDWEKLEIKDDLIDEEWERALYKCIDNTKNKFLIKKASNILICFNKTKEYFGQEFISQEIKNMVKVSSVTSATENQVETTDSSYEEIWKAIHEKIKEIDGTRKGRYSNSVSLIKDYITYSITLNKLKTKVTIQYQKNRGASHWESFKNLYPEHDVQSNKKVELKIDENYKYPVELSLALEKLISETKSKIESI